MATQSTRSMISETSICNQALAWLGAERIASIDESSRYAEFCRDNYPFIRDAVLEEHMWTFAVDRDSSTVANRDEWGVAFKHPVPQEWLQVFRVYSSTNPLKKANDWRKEGRFVLAQDATIYMYGIKRVTDTGFFSNMFVQAVAARLAADLAIPITENAQLQRDMWALYQQKLDAAATRDGQQGVNEFITQTQLTGARVNDGALIGAR